MRLAPGGFLARIDRRWRRWRARRRARRGRILAVKVGYNPNSSSLGVDVTFLLLGVAVISLLTPIVALFVRTRRARIRAAALPPPRDTDAPTDPGTTSPSA